MASMSSLCFMRCLSAPGGMAATLPNTNTSARSTGLVILLRTIHLESWIVFELQKIILNPSEVGFFLREARGKALVL